MLLFSAAAVNHAVLFEFFNTAHIDQFHLVVVHQAFIQRFSRGDAVAFRDIVHHPIQGCQHVWIRFSDIQYDRFGCRTFFYRVPGINPFLEGVLQRFNIGPAQGTQGSHGDRRSPAAAAVNHDRGIEIRQQVDMLGQFLQGDIDRTANMPKLFQLADRAHIQQERRCIGCQCFVEWFHAGRVVLLHVVQQELEGVIKLGNPTTDRVTFGRPAAETAFQAGYVAVPVGQQHGHRHRRAVSAAAVYCQGGILVCRPQVFIGYEFLQRNKDGIFFTDCDVAFLLHLTAGAHIHQRQARVLCQRQVEILCRYPAVTSGQVAQHRVNGCDHSRVGFSSIENFRLRGRSLDNRVAVSYPICKGVLECFYIVPAQCIQGCHGNCRPPAARAVGHDGGIEAGQVLQVLCQLIEGDMNRTFDMAIFCHLFSSTHIQQEWRLIRRHGFEQCIRLDGVICHHRFQHGRVSGIQVLFRCFWSWRWFCGFRGRLRGSSWFHGSFFCLDDSWLLRGGGCARAGT